MARVVLVGNLAQVTGCVAEFHLPATSVQELFRKLGELHPALAPHLETGVAVAIDGQIFQDALLEPIGTDSEVFLLPQIAGGSGGQVLHSDISRRAAPRQAGENVGM
jgi:molybdopterin converting factor small subunit